jgi:GNAT superfamily N-acetyltransferase
MSDAKEVDVRIRAPERGDMEALAELMTQLGYPTRASEMQMRMETILANKSYATFVAVNGGKVCGMIGTFAQQTYEHNSPSAKILALVVSEEVRGRGIGQALIEAAEQDLARKNIKRIAVNARFEREQAHKFYENRGYKKNGFRLVKELPMPAD